MKHYYIHYPRDFENEYSLYWVDTAEMQLALPPSSVLITRKKAIAYCCAENQRRKDGAGGFADNHIFPAGIDIDWQNTRMWQLNGYIWEKI